jgi:hypothetical protein
MPTINPVSLARCAVAAELSRLYRGAVSYLSDKVHSMEADTTYTSAMPELKRTLVWERTPAEDRFGCSGCSWTFPNPLAEIESNHDMVVVTARFDLHHCDANKRREITRTDFGSPP